ncbi:hypothetical protein JTE90_003648 [Oedothorax gibbosus]|uniref:Uncharacterized protein n=1 Tax=Oedothorax gibbosus TaxID=931172 RepID=A0AAV6TDF2_9ARAC|nr:hypothetical protein JTE90_003648 [Oedothorax gibbosus]
MTERIPGIAFLVPQKSKENPSVNPGLGDMGIKSYSELCAVFQARKSRKKKAGFSGEQAGRWEKCLPEAANNRRGVSHALTPEKYEPNPSTNWGHYSSKTWLDPKKWVVIFSVETRLSQRTF